ncbi:MAG: tRNA preQ1(34) S-adenosylmethionine ribosyltransferase-isomerase QueA [Chloroflexi bacterium]|nr:tRNA preQ1(34) S-adenosylmethionine ribosyltransferase-isomerase QueA [Chloroflexota bacterium]
MRIDEFDYLLPAESIAQTPAEPRDSARLLVVRRGSDTYEDRNVFDLPDLLQAGDLVVVNRSRVLPARVLGRLASGGQAELLLLRRLAPGRWQALARPARRLRIGASFLAAGGVRAEVVGVGDAGQREIRVINPDSPEAGDAALLAAGSVPLPPYIHGWVGDPERYQTIFATDPGSAAAPTAGLHFTPDLVARLRAARVDVQEVVLHVGLDTFRPVGEEDPAQHRMHQEWYVVPSPTRSAVQQTRLRGGRVVAVGTTCVRSLEAWSATGQAEGWTDLFILPGFRFQVVDALLTNFHLPRSTLLMLVSAFAGREPVLDAYAEAVRRGYRFFSFGDATLFL